MSETHDITLLRGNEAVGAGALRAGCRFFFGYPITPQNELFEYMAQHLPPAGGTFLQSESELAGINMLFGASAAGARCAAGPVPSRRTMSANRPSPSRFSRGCASRRAD